MLLREKLQLWSELLPNNFSTLRGRLAPLYSVRNISVGIIGTVTTIGVAAAIIKVGGKGAGREEARADSGTTISMPMAVGAGHVSESYARPGLQSFTTASGGSGGSPGIGGAFMLDGSASSAHPSLPLESYTYSVRSPEFAASVPTNMGSGFTVLGVGSPITMSSLCCNTQQNYAPVLSLNGSGSSTILKFSSNVPVVPEPSIAWLGSLGLLLVVARIRKLKKSTLNGEGPAE